MEIHTLASNSKIECDTQSHTHAPTHTNTHKINASIWVEKSLDSYKQSCVCVRRGSEGESEEERKREKEKEKEVNEDGEGRGDERER